MRKVIVSNLVTVDGFFAGPNGEIDWFVWDDGLRDYSIDMLSTVDTLLFGRVTYQLMANYWPTATEDAIIAERMNNLPKIVFQRRWKELNGKMPSWLKKLFRKRS
jgi:dihydrofolate reductase